MQIEPDRTVARPSGCRIETSGLRIRSGRLDARRLKTREFSNIEIDPVKAVLVDNADKYRWSSAGKSVETPGTGPRNTSVRATQASRGPAPIRP